MEERGRRDFDFCHCFHVAGIDYSAGPVQVNGMSGIPCSEKTEFLLLREGKATVHFSPK